MNDNPQHVFQILTKRAGLLQSYDSKGFLEWAPNIWMGVSVENEKALARVDLLRRTGAKIKFLSREPLIGPLHRMNLKKIDWVIAGGERGRRPTPMNVEWVTDVREQCQQANVPFFFKQWGGTSKKKAGRILEGRTWDEMPEEVANWPLGRVNI